MLFFALPATPTDRFESGSTRPSAGRSDGDADSKPNGIESALADLLPSIDQALDQACRFESGCPRRLGDAIRYAVLAPGKRLRPALVLMAAEACGGEFTEAMPGAVAVEMVHAYSLIHDDLPAMDDDDLRRGRPTTHIEFDEATAILAGDALQPLAISQICQNVSDPIRVARAVQILAKAAGPEYLVGGQADDLAAESGQLPAEVAEVVDRLGEHPDGSDRTSQDDEADSVGIALGFLESIHRRKTGALFAASLELGAVLVDAGETHRQALAAFASDIGLAFQVVDDLLDYTADEAELGKRVGKDTDRGKLTYPSLMGIDRARAFASDLVKSAQGHTSVFGPAAWRLNQVAEYVLARSH